MVASSLNSKLGCEGFALGLLPSEIHLGVLMCRSVKWNSKNEEFRQLKSKKFRMACPYSRMCYYIRWSNFDVLKLSMSRQSWLGRKNSSAFFLFLFWLSTLPVIMNWYQGSFWGVRLCSLHAAFLFLCSPTVIVSGSFHSRRNGMKLDGMLTAMNIYLIGE